MRNRDGFGMMIPEVHGMEEAGNMSEKPRVPLTPEETRRVMTQLFEATGVSVLLPEDPLKKARHPRKEEQKRRQKGLMFLKQTLVAEDEGWGGLNLEGLRLLMNETQHSMDVLSVGGSPETRSLTSSWYNEGSDRTNTVHIYKAKEVFVATLSERVIVVAANKLPSSDVSALQDLLRQVTGNSDLYVSIVHNRPSGMMSYGRPATVRTVSVRAPLGNRREAFAEVQVFELARVLADALDEQVKQQATSVVAVSLGKRAANPYEYSDDEFLYEKVHRETLRSVSDYLRSHPDIRESLYDVNAILERDRIVPKLFVNKYTMFLDIPITEQEEISLDPIMLDRPIDLLVVRSLHLRRPQWKHGPPGDTAVIFTLPEGYEIPIQTPFYSARAEASYSEETKQHLIDELKKEFSGLFESTREHTTSRKDRPASIKRVHEALTTLGVELGELRHLSRAEQELVVKKSYRERMMESHPDRHPDDPYAEQRAKQITEAFRVLAKEGGFEQIV